MNNCAIDNNYSVSKIIFVIIDKLLNYSAPSPFFLVFVLISLLTVVVQNIPPSKDILDGLLIPDVVGLSDAIDVFADENYDFAYILANFPGPGVLLLYWIAWLVHPALSLCVNIVLIYASLRIIYALFSKVGRHGNLACIGVICNPYLYLAVSGPNKEIPVICATALVFYLLIIKPRFWFVFSLFAASITFLFRDGYGVILVVTILLFALLGKSPRLFLLAGLLLCSTAAGLFWHLTEYLEVIARNKALLEYGVEMGDVASSLLGIPLQLPSNPLTGILSYYVKALYNLIGLSIYPQFISFNGGWYILGIAYWVFGIFIIIGICACVWTIFKGDGHALPSNARVKLSVLVIFVWSAISLSLFVQPRYLMPLLPIAFGIYVTSSFSKFKLLIGVVYFAFLVICSYYFIGYAPPLSGAIEATPSFLWTTQ
jgi:hypothetical protein